MKILVSVLLLINVLFALDFKEYLKGFDYEERAQMKVKTVEMLTLLEEGKAVLIDIRFPEEYEAWHMGFSKNIPLNELPKRLNELPRDKLIITACPHNDRANIARLFLIQQGFNARYLSDGLLKTADFLRGENAKEFLDEYHKMKEKQ